MAEGDVIYEREGEEVRAYRDLGTYDKDGRINELNATIADKNRQITNLQAEVTAHEEEITALESI
jgi:cell division protein FtsL